MPDTNDLHILSSCPESGPAAPPAYSRQVVDAARWCEAAGHEAILIRSDNRLADPWTVAQLLLHETRAIVPIVTVQPLHSHPYAVAKKVATLAALYGRAPHLNLAGGTYRADLLSLDDRTPHADRYARLLEFGTVVRHLLESLAPVEFDGDYYRVHKPATLPPLAPELQPRYYVCTSSPAGKAVAERLRATTVRHAMGGEQLPTECIRLGVLARSTEEAAWETAHARFPSDPANRFSHRLEMSLSDTRWQQDLRAAAEEADTTGSALWLQPFENRQAQCAYLVGSHADVARRLRRWIENGTRTFLLDAPRDEIDLDHTREVFDRAWKRFSSPLAVSA